MARDLAPEVERLLQFRDPNVRKKVSLSNISVALFIDKKVNFMERHQRSATYELEHQFANNFIDLEVS